MYRIPSLALIAILMSHGVATAQDVPSTETPPVPPQDTRPPEEIARVEYAAGEAYYANGQYAEAEAAFIRAYEAVSNPVVLIAVAEARARLGRGVAAVDVLERYLRVRPNATDAVAVRARIDALRAMPGAIHIESVPAGAAISIDGEASGLVTPADIELPAGTHTVALSLEGHEPIEGPLVVEFASRHEVVQELAVFQEEAPEEPAVGELEDDADPERERLSPALITTMSLSAAALVTGTVLGFTALSRESDYRRHPSESTAEEGERFALFADLALGVALAGTATSVVLHLVSQGDEDAPAETDSEPTVHFAPVLGRSVRGASMTVRF